MERNQKREQLCRVSFYRRNKDIKDRFEAAFLCQEMLHFARFLVLSLDPIDEDLHDLQGKLIRRASAVTLKALLV